MFKDWGAVVEAANQFNTDMGADFSDSAYFLPENSLDDIVGLQEKEIEDISHTAHDRRAEISSNDSIDDIEPTVKNKYMQESANDAIINNGGDNNVRNVESGLEQNNHEPERVDPRAEGKKSQIPQSNARIAEYVSRGKAEILEVEPRGGRRLVRV